MNARDIEALASPEGLEVEITDRGIAVHEGLHMPRDRRSFDALPDKPGSGFWRTPGCVCWGSDDKGGAILARRWPGPSDPDHA